MYWAFLIYSVGALDVRARQINEAMKLAAVKALGEPCKNCGAGYCKHGVQQKNNGIWPGVYYSKTT